jgi:hypothetical protein
MMKPETWNLIKDSAGKVWPVVISLAGVFAGAWLARLWDRKKWQNDNRKQEYRELLTSLTSAEIALNRTLSKSDEFVQRKAINKRPIHGIAPNNPRPNLYRR